MISEKALAIFAIVTVLGLVGVITVETFLVQQEVDARGCRNSIAVNASQGRCIH
jgi:phosphoribosylaminoimidazole carboxylase (NCAIR synthetase)